MAWFKNHLIQWGSSQMRSAKHVEGGLEFPPPHLPV